MGVSVVPLIKLSDTSKNPFLFDDYEKSAEIRIRFLFPLFIYRLNYFPDSIPTQMKALWNIDNEYLHLRELIR